MINLQNKIRIETSSSSMSDLVFLLLIFFMITSTLVRPSVLPISLPETSSETTSDAKDLKVEIGYPDETAPLQYVVGEDYVPRENLSDALLQSLKDLPAEAAIVVSADSNVTVNEIIYTLSVISDINKSDNEHHKHKVSLAAKPVGQ